MLDQNSFFELHPNLYPSNSSSSNTSNVSTAPEYLFPIQGPVLHVDQTYTSYRQSLWSKRAIAALVDWREIPDFRLQAIINSQWKLQGAVSVKAKIRNFYILEFEEVEDWSFMIRNVAVWLRFLGIPMELVSNYVAYSLGQLAGEVVELDHQNDAGRNLEYVRVKVLVDPSKPLLMGSYYPLSDGSKTWVSCMPERTYRLCEQCGRIGHLSKDCNWGLLRTYSELYHQQHTLCQNHGTYTWIDPDFIHFQCPKRKAAQWHYRESTKIQVHYDQFGLRYEISDEHTPLQTNFISGEWSSDSSDSSDENEPLYVQQVVNEVQHSPENNSFPLVGNHGDIQGEQEEPPLLVTDLLHLEGIQNEMSIPLDVQHVASAALDNILHASNNALVAGTLNAEDNLNLIAENETALQEVPPINPSLSIETLLCHEDPMDFCGEDELDSLDEVDEVPDGIIPDTEGDMDVSSPIHDGPHDMILDPPNQIQCGCGPLAIWAKPSKITPTEPNHINSHYVGPDPMEVDEDGRSTIFQLSERVKSLFEDSFMGWADVPIFNDQGSTLYSWASATLKQAEGLGLIMKATSCGDFQWDVYPCQLTDGPKITHVNKLLIVVLVVDNDTEEESLISPRSCLKHKKRKAVTFSDLVNFHEPEIPYAKKFRLLHPKFKLIPNNNMVMGSGEAVPNQPPASS
ncbi:hypothetical protein G2W53_017449 [Senna tora]|uniref:CCHC-type domain-containing protein n=1 Tax=Senna tora TaxID=362788 RepID=A0A834TU32_9FABA|nr:hypothetical protein G2W53_017449 [Senna tora]